MTVSSQATTTGIVLVSRPTGWPDHTTFDQVTEVLPELGDGEVRVRNEFVSVDPYMRGRMNLGRSYIPPFELGEIMTGGAVGHVVESRSDALPVGTPVLHNFGWRTVAQGPAAQFRPVERLDGVPLSAYLGILGTTGFTAYLGLTEIAPLRPGDRVFISGAAGAVGSTAGQIARLLGASEVLGSVGTAEKADRIIERYGFDRAIVYRDAPIREQLPKAAPDGIDIYFDNVGGDHLTAALDVFNDLGRAALCGAISEMNGDGPASGPDNTANIVTRSLTLRGFTVGRFMEFFPGFIEKMGPWLRNGDVVFDETVAPGIGEAVDAFLGMMRGANTGKMVVRILEDD